MIFRCGQRTMKFLGPSLLASFKDALQANGANKPEEKSGIIAKKNESELKLKLKVKNGKSCLNEVEL